MECEEKQNKEAMGSVTLEQMLKDLEDSVVQEAAAAKVVDEKPAVEVNEEPVVDDPVANE